MVFRAEEKPRFFKQGFLYNGFFKQVVKLGVG